MTNKNTNILLEMARVGSVAGYEVSIYGGEGNIPHFHFYTKDREKEGCIRIDRAEYFTHGNKNTKLNSKERKLLVTWLCSNHNVLPITIWEYICILWDDNNPDYVLTDDIKMPDYNTLR